MTNIHFIDFTSTLYWGDVPISKELKDFCTQYKDKNSYNGTEDLTEQLVSFFFPVQMFSDIAGKLNYKTYEATKMWIQHYNPGDTHAVHVHGTHRHDWSFLCYISCSENSSDTTFYNPGFPYIDNQRVKVKPKAGRVCLFNGGLPHEVLPNNDTTRMIISGNLVFRNDDAPDSIITYKVNNE